MKAISITDSDRLLNIFNQINDNNNHIIEHIVKISNKLSNIGIENVPKSQVLGNENLYQSKLIALLEGLGCENIPKLVKEGTIGMFKELGIEMAKWKKMKNTEYRDCFKSDTESNCVFAGINKHGNSYCTIDNITNIRHYGCKPQEIINKRSKIIKEEFEKD